MVIMPLRPGTCRVFERFAALACPPQLLAGGLMPDLRREFELQLACLPAVVRRLVPATLLVFDQAARLRAGGGFRRFARLDDASADAYLRMVLDRRRGALPAGVRLVKSLVVMCFYELPGVRAQLGYRPQEYIAQVAARRLARYGPDIAAAVDASQADRTVAE
jgi:hypothetical protein